MVVKPLTARQQEVLDTIRRFMETYGYPPSYRDLGDRVGMRSNNAVNDALKLLERKGYITRDKATARGIQLVEQAATLVWEETAADRTWGVAAFGFQLSVARYCMTPMTWAWKVAGCGLVLRGALEGIDDSAAAMALVERFARALAAQRDAGAVRGAA
jgi:hypothetical protein